MVFTLVVFAVVITTSNGPKKLGGGWGRFKSAAIGAPPPPAAPVPSGIPSSGGGPSISINASDVKLDSPVINPVVAGRTESVSKLSSDNRRGSAVSSDTTQENSDRMIKNLSDFKVKD